MTFLTANAKRITLPPMLQKTAGGTTTPVNHKAYSRYNVKPAFFVPVTNRHTKSPDLWALFGAETKQFVEGRHLCGTSKDVDGCGNSLQCPPYLITTGLLGSHNSTTKVLIMTDKQFAAHVPQDCFILDPSVDRKTLLSPAHQLLLRAQACLSLLQDNGNSIGGFDATHGVVMGNLDSAEAFLTQAITLIDESIGEGM